MPVGAAASLTDSFTAVSSDGTASQLVTVTVHGGNDIPVIDGVAAGSVQEDNALASGSLDTSADLDITDVDHTQSTFQPTDEAGVAGSNGYGTFTLDASGH